MLLCIAIYTGRGSVCSSELFRSCIYNITCYEGYYELQYSIYYVNVFENRIRNNRLIDYLDRRRFIIDVRAAGEALEKKKIRNV